MVKFKLFKEQEWKVGLLVEFNELLSVGIVVHAGESYRVKYPGELEKKVDD